VRDSRRELGSFAVLALVFLRLAIGWHFFSEGVEKIDRDPQTGRYRIGFSAAGFLAQARGPLEKMYHSLAPDGHDWQTLLAVPHQNLPPAAEEPKAGGDQAPYQNWFARIVADWHAILDQAIALPGLSEQQVRAARAAFELRERQLKDYLASEEGAISQYQHELWRLREWQAQPEATGAPFAQERIAKKDAETTAAAKAWVAQVDQLQQGLVEDLRQSLQPEQPTTTTHDAAIDAAVTIPEQQRLQRVNLAATVLTLGVGICLLLGLFTRLASLAAAVFLLSIIATQPPWLAAAEPTIYQTVELAAVLVLAGTGAGRWLGLDYFSWVLFHKHDE
jgi:uncharacterized membrane protein YphA (DoxX/SURF4 family)